MLKVYTLLIVVIFFADMAKAQRKVISGYLKDSITLLPIASGSITNTDTRQTVLTDSKGFFYLEAAPNDLIYATAKDYRYDTLHYSILLADTITIFLPPSGTVLQNVTVASGYDRYRMDSLARRKEFEEARGQTLNTFEKTHTSGFGLVINMDRFFKSKYKHQKRNEQSFTNTEKMAYVTYRFSPQLVSFYTGLKGDALLDFIQRYQPSYEWLRQHTSREELIDYISDKLKAYKSAERHKTGN